MNGALVLVLCLAMLVGVGWMWQKEYVFIDRVIPATGGSGDCSSLPVNAFSFNVCKVSSATAYYNVSYLDEGTGNYTLRVV